MKYVLAVIGVVIVILLLSGGTQNSDQEDRIYELESCIEEYQSAISEYKYAVDEAHSNLSYWGEGDDYYDLVNAIDEAESNLDIGDVEPTCY